jgi:hypothetical protein
MSSGSFKLKNGDQISFNYKCIVLSIFFGLFYWFAPSKNKWILAAILYFTYLALAWYDHFYGCTNNSLKPTFLYSFYGALKPKDYRQEYARWKPGTKRLVASVDVGIALLLLAGFPFFLKWNPSCA